MKIEINELILSSGRFKKKKKKELIASQFKKYWKD